MSSAETLREATGRLQSIGLIVGAVAAALLALGYYTSPADFFPAYLVAFLFWLGISLGCLAVAMIHHLSGGGWGIAIRRILEAGYSLLPLLAILFLPLLLGLPTLYPWARPEEVAHDELLQRKTQYLDVTFFQYRALSYFLVWIGTALVLNFMSAGSDIAGEFARRRRLALLSGPGLILWCLTVTFASVDWAMSLEPHWYSSMYGVLFMAGQGVSGLALAILTLLLLKDRVPLGDGYSSARQHDLGNMLLAFVLFWSYVSFSQYLIIWSGNLPEETLWYINRGAVPVVDGVASTQVSGWLVVVIVIMALHFLVPFLLLLSRQTKRSPRWLIGIAILLLVMRFVDLYWLVMPAFSPRVFKLHWLNLVAPLAIGGFWVAAFAWRLDARAALPVFDLPAEEEAADDVARAPAH